MTNRFLLLLLCSAFCINAFAQTSLNYNFTTATASSLAADKYGNTLNFSARPDLIAAGNTSVNSSLLPIGFDFVLMGKRYTHFIAGNDGEIALGLSTSPAGMLSAAGSNMLLRTISYPPTSFNDAPVLAAFWDDLRTSRAGATVRSVLTGSSPYRCLTLQWNAVINAASATATDPADGVFQLRIYEGSGEIEYVYGKMTIGTGSSTVTASIGLATGPSDNGFVALKDLSAFGITRLAAEEFATRSLVNSAVPGTIAALHSTADGARRNFLFAPAPLNGTFADASVSRVYATTMQLNWTETSSNKLGYLLYRSDADSNNYQLVGTLPSATSSYTAANLAINTRYYWKLVPFNEGSTKNIKVFTDSTRCSMAGTYTIGAAGNFLSVKAAQDSLYLWGQSGNATWQLLPGYSFAGESLPLTFKGAAPCQNNTLSLTVQPAGGASVQFVNTTANPVFLLDSANKITIDGRPAGASSGALVLEGSGELVRLKNSWANSVQFVDFRSNTSTAAAPLTIEATTGGGSHDNLINACSFHDRGSYVPQQLVVAKTTGSVVNNNNQITNSEFYNFSRFAIDIDGRGWTVSNNSFYATAPVSSAADSCGFILLRSRDNSVAHVVNNNHFGGSAAGSNGSVFTWNSGTSFIGIHAIAKAAISNNVFRKLHVRFVAPSAYQPSINLVQTGVPLNYTPTDYTVQQNNFGGLNPADSISFSSTSASGVIASVINNLQTSGTATITGNNLVHIRTFGNNSNLLNLRLIGTSGQMANMSNNTIGTANQLYRIEHKAVGDATGIYTYGRASIAGNLLTNIAARGRITGILTQENYNDITNNTISYIKTLEGQSTYDFYSACGIATFRGSQSITGNRILHIEDSSSGTSTVPPRSVFVKESGNTISRNLIDGLIQNPAGAPKLMVAFDMEDNYSTITNNMVRLGVDSAGNTVTKGGFLCYSNDYTALNVVRHNTFYITGSNVPGTNNNSSFNIFWLGPSQFANNIIVNNRSYTGSGTGNAGSYFYLLSTESQNYNLFDYNVYYRSAGYGNFTTGGDYAQWQAGGTTGRDRHSVIMAPNFIAAEGPTRLLNLHVTGVTPVERRGSALYTATDDFDGEIRSSLTPVDVGADAGNFIPVDLDAPTFTVTPLADATDTASRTITIRIVDSLSGLRLTGNTRPTIWYRKFYPATTAWQTAFGDWTGGSATDGTWRFSINHGLLGVSPFGADSVQYYFVAQDTAGNVGISPAAGGVHTSVTQQVAAPAQPYRYRINAGRYFIPSVVDVGTGQRYTSLTRDGGVFEGLAKDSVQGDITIRIASHLTENGKWGVDSLLKKRGYKLTIAPASDSVFIVKNGSDISAEMLRFSGTANVTIDGSYNGSGRWLRFISQGSSAATAASTMLFTKGADNVRIQNCELQTNAAGYQLRASLYFSNGDFKNLVLQNNVFSSISGNTFKAGAGVSTWIDAKIAGLTAVQNHFVNLENTGVMLNGPWSGVRIDSNHFYWNDAVAQSGTSYWAITTTGVNSTLQVKGNHIGGSAPYCGGGYWLNSGAFNEFVGIKAITSSKLQSLVANNTVRNIKTTNTAASYFSAISVSGTFLVDHNTIGDSTAPQSLNLACTGPTILSVGDMNCTTSNNLIAGIEGTNTGNTATLQAMRLGGDSAYVVRNNTIRNISIAATTTGSTAGTLTGIAVPVNGSGTRIEANEIFNLTCTSTQAVHVAGIQCYSAYNGGATIAGNRIYNLMLPASSGGTIHGVWLYQNGPYRVENNQLSLTNGSNTNAVNVYGIHHNYSANTVNNASVAYNSVYIGGSQASGNTVSFGFYQDGIGTTSRFKNNLLYNNRSGGTGQHGGIGIKRPAPTTHWSPATSDFNLFVLNDTANAHLWGTSTQLSMRAWKNATGGDAASYLTLAQSLPASTFFADVTKGNLNINNGSPLCWYVNGKGLPLADVADDYVAQGVRSINVANGATDIGSNEFTTVTAPPALDVYGRHLPGETDTLAMNGRVLAVINWSATGSLPVLGTARFYSGTWPADPTNNGTINGARSMNGYLQIPATGGTGYAYNLQLFYDSSMLGAVNASQSMILNKRQSGVPGSWTEVHPNIVDTARKKLTAFGMTSFSDFTATDSLASFISGGPLPDLSILSPSLGSANIATGSSFNVSFTESNSGSATAPAHLVRIYLSADNVLTPGINGDSLLGEYNAAAPLAAGGSTGTITKSVTTPCGIAAGSYFIFVVADATNLVAETNEANNTAFTATAVIIGQTVPVASLTTTNNAVVCGSSPVLLTASATGCTACNYNWNTGNAGPTLSVAAAGTYTVSVSNACGTGTAGQVVTAAPVPAVTLTAGVNSLCLGQTVTFTAGGATSYAWSGPGVNANGSTATAVPAAVGSPSYSVTGTANGCSQTKTITVTVNGVPAAPAIMQNGNQLLSSATSGNQWYLNNAAISGATGATYLPQAAGVYSVTITVNGCSSPASASFNYVITAINSPSFDAQLVLAPNPVQTTLLLRYSGPAASFELQVFDLAGRRVKPVAVFTSKYMMDVQALPAGIYVMQVTNRRTQETVRRTFVKR